MGMKISSMEELFKELNKNFKVYVRRFANQEQLKALQYNHKTISCLFKDHEDKNPSMLLNETSGFCFKCGKMDIFKAAEEFEGRSISTKKELIDTAIYLAKKLELDIDDLKKSDPIYEEKLELYNFFEEMRSFLVMGIKGYSSDEDDWGTSGSKIKKWTEAALSSRGISIETAIDYGIGYLDYDEFCKHLKNKMIDYTQFEKYGFRKDNFTKSKLTFMINDEEGRPVSFSVREMVYDVSRAKQLLASYVGAEKIKQAKNSELKALAIEAMKHGMTEKERELIATSLKTAKYINGNDSPIFKKKELLYGLDKALENRGVFTKIVAVEGYMDVITAKQHGNNNVVAYCSGDLTDQQIEKLKKYNFNQIILFPDNDETGKKKIEKLIEKSQMKKIEVEVAELKEEFQKYKDLDEVLNDREEHQIDILLLLDIKNIILKSYEQFKKDGKDKKTLLKELAKTLSRIEEPIDREVLKQELEKVMNKTEAFAVKDEAEMILKLRDKEVMEKIKKINKDFLDKLLESPENYKNIMDSFGNDMEKNIGEKATKKKSWKEISMDKNKEIEERKETIKAEKVFGTKALDDLKLVEAANIMIAGKPNTGKTQFMVNTGVTMLKTDPNSALIIISNDDSTFKLKTRVIAILANITTNIAQNPKGTIKKFNNMQERLRIQKAYDRAISEIDDLTKDNRLLLLGSDIGIRTLEEVEYVCAEHTESINGKEVNKMLLVDPASKFVVNGSDKPTAVISDFLKNRIVANYGYTTIQNYELTKVGFIRKRKTQYEDMSGGKELAYDGDVIFIVNNPLHDHGSQAKSVWVDGFQNTNPIIAIENGKDKVSDMKGRIYLYKLEGSKAKMHELSKDSDDYNEVKANYLSDMQLYNE